MQERLRADENIEHVIEQEIDLSPVLKWHHLALVAAPLIVSVVIWQLLRLQSTEGEWVHVLPTYLLAGGVLVSMLVSAVVLQLSRQRRDAMLLAKRIADEYKASALKSRISEERYDLAIEGSAVGIWDWDIVNDDLVWSDHFFDMLGEETDTNHVTFDYYNDRLHPEDAERLTLELKEHLEQRKPFHTEYRLRHNQGHHIWVHVGGQALWDAEGNPTRMAGTATNITDQKLAADKLLSMNAELVKFAHLASHDLKTPLLGISSLTQWIEEDEELSEESLQRLHMIRDRVALTLTMLKDILIYSESGVASVQTEWVSPSAMLEEIVDSLELTEHQRVIFEKDLPQIYTVSTQLRQVFTNVITNGFNHHDRDNQTITVSCQVKPMRLDFTITDDGPGIAPSYHKKVFELFHTLKAKGKGGGSGLGMSIIKRLVESQNGEIWIESEEGKRGTSICFTWPAMQELKVA